MVGGARKTNMKFRIVIEQDEDGKFVGSCPTLPGCWSQGDTCDEARRYVADAIKAYVASLRKQRDPIPVSAA